MSKSGAISTLNTQNTHDEVFSQQDVDYVIKITADIIQEVKKGHINTAVKILKELSMDTEVNINVSDLPLIDDKPYQKSVVHILQDEGLTTEANAFGSHCQALGYINEFYYEF